MRINVVHYELSTLSFPTASLIFTAAKLLYQAIQVTMKHKALHQK